MNEAQGKLPFEIGDSCSFTKTISESDVYMFAGITGDFSRMHTDEEFMKKTIYGRRMAHGVLTFAIGVTATTQIQVQARAQMPSVSYGFDRLRFTHPVFPGDTVTATYTISEVDQENLKTYGKLEIRNQRGDLCVAATHILKFFLIEEVN